VRVATMAGMEAAGARPAGLSKPQPPGLAKPPRQDAPSQLLPAWALVLADYARHTQLSNRARTAASYLDVLRRLTTFGVEPLEAGRADLERFLTRSARGRWGDRQGPLSASTRNAELAALRCFYHWARGEGLRHDDPTQGIRPPRRQPYARARGLTAEQVGHLLAVIPAQSLAGKRLRALVLMFVLTGRRRSEVLRLRWRDLDLASGHYSYTGKGGKERRRLLPTPARQAIEAYTVAAGAASRPDDAVFCGRWADQPIDGSYVGSQLKQAAQLAGVELERPLHTLRHSYARALRQVEAPLEHVQAALDHSNLATTAVYLGQLESTADPWWPKLASAMGLEESSPTMTGAAEPR
jgi:integrase/recombinase XerD